VSIKYKLLVFVWSIILLISGVFTYYLDEVQKNEYIEGIDEKLFTSAMLAKESLPADYHDKLVDKNSVSPARYLRMIDHNNRLCRELGLQYLWSNMVIDDKIVFTSSTSTSKDVSNGDHALFFDVHSNPEAFEGVLSSGTTTYSTFENEWGKGRMVLVPYFDKHGRRYVFGASISINEFDERLADLDRKSFSIFLASFLIGGVISILISNTITRPIRNVSEVARDIAGGGYGKQISSESGGVELKTLVKSINNMSRSIYEHNENLEQLVMERTKELRLTEKQLVESHAREQHASKMASLGEMASNIGHEINSPLQAILLITYRVKSRIESLGKNEIEDSMDQLNGFVSRISTIIESLKRLTRDSQNEPYTSTPIHNLVADVTEITKERFRVHGVEFMVNYQDDCQDSLIECQNVQISQVLVNLLNNAFDAVKEVDDRWIRIDVVDNGDTAVIRVSDSGKGVPKELQQKIFEPMFTTKEVGKGTGIGLSISSEIAKKHHGVLELDTSAAYTTFVLELPKRQQA
jgi:signal transduction histidine kinase